MFSLFSSLFRQSLHSGGIVLLIIALSLGISATTALKFSNQQIQYAIEQQAAELLAADLVLSSTQPLATIWQQRAEQTDLSVSTTTVFTSMAHAGDAFVMVNVKAIDDAFPLRGELEISGQSKPLQVGEIWLSSRVFELLNVKTDDKLFIADAEFTVKGEITRDSNQETGFSGFSPTVIIHQKDVERTNAIQAGSRIDHRLLMAGSPEQIEKFQAEYKDSVAEPLKLRSATDGNSRLMRPIQNLETYMQLANLLTLLLCGIAIALTAQRYVAQNQSHIAMLRCVGASRKSILGGFIALLGVVGGIATVIGSGVGVLFGYLLLNLMLSSLPQIQLEFSVWSIVLGPLPNAIFTCLIVLVGFVLPSIVHLSKIPPNRVLRQGQIDQVGLRILFLSVLISLTIFSLYLTENIKLTLAVIGGILGLCLILFGMTWTILKTLKLSYQLEQWLREPAKLSLQTTALALGLSLISILFLLRVDLFERWEAQLPQGTPNQFVYGLPPFDKDLLEQMLKEKNWQYTPLYPNVRGRLIAKNDEPFDAELIKNNNSLRRELNLTQSDNFPQDNKISEGASGFKQANEVSVELETAKQLNLKLGDQLSFELPEGNIHATIVSFRQVQWESFSPNFFFIFSPQTFDENAGSYLGSFYVPPEQDHQMAEMIQNFPTTVFIDINGIIDQVKKIIGLITQIVSLLAFLVLISGVLVLLACLNLIMDERRHEVALLRAIGMSQKRLKHYLTVELGAIGLAAGIISIAFAEVISWIVAWRMELSWSLHYPFWLILPLFMALVCAVIGRYRLKALWQITPLHSLRGMD